MTLILGLTGGIGAGKSTVAAIFAELGATVVSADQLAREVVAPGTPTLQALVAVFGTTILDATGHLAREQLAEIIFADPQARERLNAIIHPTIATLAESRLQALRRQQVPLVVYEAPLLFEAGAEGRVDRILAVIASPKLQEQRLCTRDRIDPAAARERIAAQWPQAEKVARADYIIDNSGELAETRRQVRALYQQLLTPPPA